MPARIHYIWLSRRRGIGPGTANELLRAFGSPEAVYAAGREQLITACRLSKAQTDALCDKSLDEAEHIIGQCVRTDIQIITAGDSAYPDRLRAIEDPPLVLYVRGRWPDFDLVPGIAVVGTRKATNYGRTTAAALGSTLARAGFITVSGMALGADGEAHRGALRAGGLTVAVLAGGPDVCYPPQHRSLMGDILLSGAVVSEYPPGAEPLAANYHNRNRIISGLSVATVVVEAPSYRSGSLITARHALDQGRDVYAVPGTLDAPQSAACNALIEKGEAALLRSPSALVRTYSGLLPQSEQVRVALRRTTGSIPERGAADTWDATPAQRRNAPRKTTTEKHALRGEERRSRTEQTSPRTEQPGASLWQSLSEDERLLAGLVQQGLCTAEALIERCGLPAPRVMSLITMLEMDGVLRREKGKLVLGCDGYAAANHQEDSE